MIGLHYIRRQTREGGSQPAVRRAVGAGRL